MRHLAISIIIALALHGAETGISPRSALGQPAVADLPPPPVRGVVRMGRRLYQANLSLAATLPGTFPDDASERATLHAILFIIPFDGRPIPDNFRAALTLSINRRAIRVPLNLVPTSHFDGSNRPIYSGSVPIPSNFPRTAAARIDLRARNTSGSTTLHRVRISETGPTQ